MIAKRLCCLIVLLGVLLITFAAGCGGAKSEPAKPATSATPATTAQATTPSVGEKKPVLAQKPGEWKADGLIADNEYSKVQSLAEVKCLAELTEKVRIALKAKTNVLWRLVFDPRP